MATLRTLVTTARNAKRGRALASGGRWKAVRYHDGIRVYHHTTEMILITPENDIIAINEGWGSMTDKKGVREIARGVGIITSYNEIFGVSSKRGTRTETARKVDVLVRGTPIFARARQAEARRLHNLATESAE